MVKLKASADGITKTPDIWSIGYGWTAAAGSTLSNTYIVSSHGGAFPGATFTSSSNIVTNFAMTNATNTGSEKGVYDKAMTNSNLTSFLDFLPDGTPVPKFAPGTYSLSYDLGGKHGTPSRPYRPKSQTRGYAPPLLSHTGTAG